MAKNAITAIEVAGYKEVISKNIRQKAEERVSRFKNGEHNVLGNAFQTDGADHSDMGDAILAYLINTTKRGGIDLTLIGNGTPQYRKNLLYCQIMASQMYIGSSTEVIVNFNAAMDFMVTGDTIYTGRDETSDVIEVFIMLQKGLRPEVELLTTLVHIELMKRFIENAEDNGYVKITSMKRGVSRELVEQCGLLNLTTPSQFNAILYPWVNSKMKEVCSETYLAHKYGITYADVIPYTRLILSEISKVLIFGDRLEENTDILSSYYIGEGAAFVELLQYSRNVSGAQLTKLVSMYREKLSDNMINHNINGKVHATTKLDEHMKYMCFKYMFFSDIKLRTWALGQICTLIKEPNDKDIHTIEFLYSGIMQYPTYGFVNNPIIKLICEYVSLRVWGQKIDEDWDTRIGSNIVDFDPLGDCGARGYNSQLGQFAELIRMISTHALDEAQQQYPNCGRFVRWTTDKCLHDFYRKSRTVFVEKMNAIASKKVGDFALLNLMEE